MEAQSKMRTCTTLFKSFFCFCFWRALKRTKKKATAFESMPGSPVSQERLGYSGSPQILHLSKMRWKRPHIGPALQGIWAVELPSACHLWGGIDPHQLFPLWVLQLGPALCVGSSFRHSNRFYGWFSGCSITEPWTSKCWLVSLSLCRLGSLLEARFMPGKIQNDLFCTWPHFNWGLVEAYILEGLNTAVLNSLTLSACFNLLCPPTYPLLLLLIICWQRMFFFKSKGIFLPPECETWFQMTHGSLSITFYHHQRFRSSSPQSLCLTLYFHNWKLLADDFNKCTPFIKKPGG